MKRKSKGLLLIALILIGIDFTILGLAQEEVVFPDPNLELVIREAINKPQGPITNDDLKGLTKITASRRNISDLRGIEHCINLQKLSLLQQAISNIGPIEKLSKLERIDLKWNQITDIGPLRNLSSLAVLELHSNRIKDITPIKGLVNLRVVDLSRNPITDISPLENLIKLESLRLDHTAITNMNPIVKLSNAGKLESVNLSCTLINVSDLKNLSVTSLYLIGNQIKDITPLANLSQLKELDLGHNQISKIDSLRSLSHLKMLGLRHNQISKIDPIDNLTSLSRIDLYNNQINDITPFVNLLKNRARLIKLQGGRETGPDIRLLGLNLFGPTKLNLSNNKITDISPLLEIIWTEGYEIDLRNNPLSPHSIDNCIPKLQEKGVRILYDQPEPVNQKEKKPNAQGEKPTVEPEAIKKQEKGRWSVEAEKIGLVSWGDVKHTALLQNFPNPFNPDTWIPFQLAEPTEVNIRIYNVKGQIIRTISLGLQKPGFYLTKEKAAYWDGRNESGKKVASGVYFYTLQAGGFFAAKKMVILK